MKNCSDCFLNNSALRILDCTRASLLRLRSARTMTAGSSVVSQGAIPTYAYCLSQGRIDAIELKLNGDHSLIFSVHRQEIFPLKALLRKEPTKFEYKTMEQTMLCEFPIDSLRSLIVGDVALENMLLRKAWAFEDDILKRIRTLLTPNASDKVLMTLNYFKDERDMCRFSRKEIASWTGLSLETVVRSLSTLEKKKKIKKGDGEILVYGNSSKR